MLNRPTDDGDVTTLQTVELGVLGPLQVRQYGLPVAIPGAKPRAVLTMLGLHAGAVVPADILVELLWGTEPPRTAVKALQTHISSLRRTLGDGFVLTVGTGWALSTTEIDVLRYTKAAKMGRDAVAANDSVQAVARFDEALALWRGAPDLPDGQRGASEKTRWIEGHAALVEDRADALLATGRAAEIVGELEAAVAEAPLRERRWGQLMLALYRAGRQGDALGAYRRARSLLASELGVDPGPELRRLEAAIVAQDSALDIAVTQQVPSVTRAVTFLLTDIEGSTAAWEAHAGAMAIALARHDELVEQVVTSRGGRLIKTRGEGDATFSVFERPSAAAAAAIELQEAMSHEPWALRDPMLIRVALHTGEVELRDGDYFGRAVNRAARLRSLAAGGQILCSGATAELVIDSLAEDVVLADLGMRQLKNLARPEHVFELRLQAAKDRHTAPAPDVPMERPALPTVLAGPGPFVGRGRELDRLLSIWQTVHVGGVHATLIAGEPGVGKTRLAGEWARQAHELRAVVLYGRCDEDLGAPYQPFAEALRSLIPCLGVTRLRRPRGVEALLTLVPGLADVLPDLTPPPRADPDTERYALFDAVVAVLGVASQDAPVVLILDDLHWAAKPTLLLLRHLLRFGEHARVQIVGTYRSTDLDRSHPLAAMLADLHRDGTANRINLSGLDENDVTAYLAEAGYDDEELGYALASVTGGNPFFLIEALRHVDESGGVWDPSTLPQGVREAVSRRLSRLPEESNKALAAAAVVGSRFAVELVERVVDQDLVDAFDEACKAGIIIEEPGGHYRFNHAIVRQSLLAELASVRRMRLHQRIAATLENTPGADDELLAELAHHYFECAWAGNAAKAVWYCRRAADQAMVRLAYEGAAELYDRALHALEELDEELPDREEQQAELLVARCEALLAAGDMVSAASAVSQLQDATRNSDRLAAWATCFDGQLSMLTHPERLDEVAAAVGAAAERLAVLNDAAGEAKAHTVRAGCLARLGRIGDCETALDSALTAARRAGEFRRVNGVLANAPLAALWGPNPVARAGGRCLDVVRLLRITADSPVVEATSMRCQAVLEAFRGHASAARRMIDSTRRAVSELGLRHALLEVEHFAGIVEMVADDPAGAEPSLRRAYNGFRRMGLDTDTAEAAALLARVCLVLDRDTEADELCSESEHLAGHALKSSIAWRTVRAQLLARRGAHDEARRVAEEAVAIAERTDALVDHGDACLALATVLSSAGDVAGARIAAERAVGLYEQKGAAALVDRARHLLSNRDAVTASPPPETPSANLHNECVRVMLHLDAVFKRRAWDEYEEMYAPDTFVESRRKIVGFTQADLPSGDWPREARRLTEMSGGVRQGVVAVRGERLALIRLEIGTEDLSLGAPRDEFLALTGIDAEGRIALQVFFDAEDIGAAIAELDAVHAQFGSQNSRPPLQNTASRVEDRCYRLFADDRQTEIGVLLTADTLVDDRRQGLRRRTNDRATALENINAIAELGATVTNTPLALRGDLLCLSRIRFERRETHPDAFSVETLEITEVNPDGMMTARVVFDPDDFEAAITEFDARYLAGEAALYAHTWSLIARAYAGLNQGELPEVTEYSLTVDHRHAAAMAPGEGAAYFRASLELTVEPNVHIEAVHRLSDLGAVVTHVGKGTSRDGFEAEWRTVDIMTVEGDLINRVELFDETNLDAALARFEELSRPALQLENAASRVAERVFSSFVTRDWESIGGMLADDIAADDRRCTTNAGLRHGRAAEIENWQAAASVGFTNLTPTVIAIRGGRLLLARLQASGRDPEAIRNENLLVIEIDADERIVAIVVFEFDDFEAAIWELDARYLAGESAANAHTWSIVMAAYAAINRLEPPPITPDWVAVDHRGEMAFGPDELFAYLRAGRDVDQDTKTYIEAVHRLNGRGAVITYAANEISREGFDAEWRGVTLLTVDGDMVDRCEVFDEADLDAAIARLEELQPTSRLPQNAASQAGERFLASIAAGDWDDMAQILDVSFSSDDRRRVVGAGVRHGRDAQIADVRAIAELWISNVTATVIATRGERLALMRACYSDSDEGSETILTEVLGIFEINADEHIVAAVSFDANDIDAAFEELDARYLAGEGTGHAHTWSVITEGFAALNRRELPATTPDWVNIDHRRGTSFAPGELPALLASWNLAPHISSSIKVVHRLNDLGAVLNSASYETSQEGVNAEWRVITVLTIEGNLIDRLEVFDEADLDTALVRFEELDAQVRRLENAASRAHQRILTYFNARDWDGVSEVLADQYHSDDRRNVPNVGLRHGRDVAIANMSSTADLGVVFGPSDPIATRGKRLVLSRTRWSDDDQRPPAFHTEVLVIVEIDAADRIRARVWFDANDIDAAYEELDARYLAGEAAAHARAWSAITDGFAALNRYELPPTTSNFVNIDHRRGTTHVPGDLFAYLRAAWDLTPDRTHRIEVVHRLSDVGSVFTAAAYGTTQEGFDAEWRMIPLLTFEGDLLKHCEIFDENDLEAALARFDELSRPAPRLENAATRADARVFASFSARDWEAATEALADDFCSDDRRPVVNVGIRHGRDVAIAEMRTTADLGIAFAATMPIATRGERLVLSRAQWSWSDQRAADFHTQVLGILEIDPADRIRARVWFDANDIDAAYTELDARYLDGEAAAHAHTWSAVTEVYAAINRHEYPAMSLDSVCIDHRPLVPIQAMDLEGWIRGVWDLTPNLVNRIETVNRLSDFGAVVTHAAHGTSHEGFDAEWRMIVVLLFDRNRIARLELFQEGDLDAALTRFDE